MIEGANQKQTLSNYSQIIFITLFFAGAQLCCAFYCGIMLTQKPFFLTQPSMFSLFFIQFHSANHILSTTAGD
jgi:hypothetical protein